MLLGIATAILAVTLAFAKEKCGSLKQLFMGLLLLLILVNAAGYFGGGISFGPTQMMPPF